VACKQWNQLPADGFHWTGNSYDNTGELSASSWRQVKFIEQFPAGQASALDPGRWLMMSDVCKHCVAAPCQQACPTGAISHNEFGNVYIQPDICNGCAYCIAACPFGVITCRIPLRAARSSAAKRSAAPRSKCQLRSPHGNRSGCASHAAPDEGAPSRPRGHCTMVSVGSPQETAGGRSVAPTDPLTTDLKVSGDTIVL